uniref:Uncharacterized protein n=1 Tax=Rhizophora mucronata TaxID=61149 RepID=A0A2P2NX55_RHIMU
MLYISLLMDVNRIYINYEKCLNS